MGPEKVGLAAGADGFRRSKPHPEQLHHTADGECDCRIEIFGFRLNVSGRGRNESVNSRCHHRPPLVDDLIEDRRGSKVRVLPPRGETAKGDSRLWRVESFTFDETGA